MRKALRWLVLRLLPGSLSLDSLAALVREAEFAIGAGVRPTLREWSRLSSPEQEAWHVAHQRAEALGSVRSALASGQPYAAAALAEPLDGGAMRKSLNSLKMKIQVEAAAAAMSRGGTA